MKAAHQETKQKIRTSGNDGEKVCYKLCDHITQHEIYKQSQLRMMPRGQWRVSTMRKHTEITPHNINTTYFRSSVFNVPWGTGQAHNGGTTSPYTLKPRQSGRQGLDFAFIMDKNLESVTFGNQDVKIANAGPTAKPTVKLFSVKNVNQVPKVS